MNRQGRQSEACPLSSPKCYSKEGGHGACAPLPTLPFQRLSRSRRLGLEVAEHEVLRLIVQFGLESELVLQRDRARRGGSCRDFVDQPFHVRVFRVSIVAEH